MDGLGRKFCATCKAARLLTRPCSPELHNVLGGDSPLAGPVLPEGGRARGGGESARDNNKANEETKADLIAIVSLKTREVTTGDQSCCNTIKLREIQNLRMGSCLHLVLAPLGSPLVWTFMDGHSSLRSWAHTCSSVILLL